MCIYIYIYIHICMCVYIYIHTYVYTHAYSILDYNISYTRHLRLAGRWPPPPGPLQSWL